MANTLIERWLGGASDPITILDEAGVSVACERTREVGRQSGLMGDRLERLVTAVSELATNQIRDGRNGFVAIRPNHRGNVIGLEVVVGDRGIGLADPVAALSALRGLADELDIETRRDEGTCFRIRKFAEPVTRRFEVGIWALPKAGEDISGDDCGFVRNENELMLLVADGLGHGPHARAASHVIVDSILGNAAMSLADAVKEAALCARDTRGAAVSVVRILEGIRQADGVGVGNVQAFCVYHDRSQHFDGSAWTVGGKSSAKGTIPLKRLPVPSRAAVAICSDGVSTSVIVPPAILVEHPVIIAQSIAAQYGRDTDDVTVLVAR